MSKSFVTILRRMDHPADYENRGEESFVSGLRWAHT